MNAKTKSAPIRDRLIERLGAVVAQTGLDLEDIEVVSAGKRNLIRVVVDGDDGVDLDDIASVSECVSASLDADDFADVLNDPYVLEVTSPGVERPLTQQRHWRRAIGRLVNVDIADASASGRIEAVDDAGITLDVAGQRRQIGWDMTPVGHVQLEFNRRSMHDDAEEL